MMRTITFAELQSLLASDPGFVLAEVGIAGNVQLSIPTDGKGLRLLVETEKGKAGRLPELIHLRIGDEQVDVPLEIRETAQRYRAIEVSIGR